MNFKSVARSVFFAFLIACLFLVLSSVLVYFNLISEKAASIIFFAGCVIGVLTGAMGTARTSDSKILINSLFVGLMFCLILLIVSAFINDGFAIHTRTATLMGSVVASSFIGAVFGK